MNRPPPKPFRCEVVSETVTIALRRRASLPAPRSLDLFADEVSERQQRRAESR